MNVTCTDRERIFLDGNDAEWSDLAQHAESCAECAEELRIWKSISSTAPELRQDWNSPQLWKNIESKLDVQLAQKPSRLTLWLHSLRLAPFQWQTAGAFAVFLIVSVTLGLLLWPRHGSSDGPFLQGGAVRDVERAEAAYQKAIDNLDAQARAQLDPPTTPLMASYREKLLVLDSAIEELREQAGQNPANAHLRRQLLAMYQEKQETLREVLETKR